MPDLAGREERLEDARLEFLGHTGAVVRERHVDVALSLPCADDDLAAAVLQRLLRVVQEVQEHLLELALVQLHLGHQSQAGDHADVVHFKGVPAQVDHPSEHLFNVHALPLARPLAGEREQVADDPGGALRFVLDRAERMFAFCALEPAEDLRVPQDGGERVVQFVRDACHQLPEGLKPRTDHAPVHAACIADDRRPERTRR